MKTIRDVYGRQEREFSARREELTARLPGRGEVRLFSSPGRAEIIGNHTDHNRGRAIVSALSCDILAAVREKEGVAEIFSRGHRPIRVPLHDLAPKAEERGRSSALVRGTLAALRKSGPIAGFTAVTSSTVFRGAGVSSSAAFSLLVAEIENALARDGTLSVLEKARAAQEAENDYFGKPCGLLDQCGVAMGGLNEIDFLDPSRPAVRPLPPPKGYRIVLTNTGGSHAGLTAHYAAIKREMEEVAAYFRRGTLREVQPSELYDALPMLRKRVSERAILRAIHFFEENERVSRAAQALGSGREDLFLAQIRGSGESSLMYLQNCFVPGSAYQPIVLALKLSEKLSRGGAFRIMGGGFAGAVLGILPEEETEGYVLGMAKVFGRENVHPADIRPVGTTELKI